MIHVELPAGFAAEEQKLPFFLAMEEWLARQRHGEYFFMWQVAPTVIFGRNQLIDAEVNLDYCRREGIQTYRRKSGGGCVFADRNNIMFSHITTSDAVATTFSAFTHAVAGMLCAIGMDASATGRNDILIGDRKVSGYAFYHINLPHGSRAIVHGTMLYDADVERMTQALTPSATKLEAKGVASVRKRVTTIREHSSIGLEEFKDFARNTLCDSTMTLTMADISEIREIEQGYYTDAWIYGRRKCASQPVPQRVEGVGEFSIDLTVAPQQSDDAHPRIQAIDMAGDFFITADIDAAIIRPLAGCQLTHEAITAALSRSDLPHVIPGMTADTLADLILQRAATIR